MSHFVAFFDANVLYPGPVKNFLMAIFKHNLFRPKWSDQVHAEWMAAVLRNRPNLNQQQVEKMRDYMNDTVEDCLVNNFDFMVDSLDLPDPKDRHVLAAAIHCKAQTIVTFNLKDFPPDKFNVYDIEAQHPDDFIMYQIDLSLPAVLEATKRFRDSLKNPPMDVNEFLDYLERQGLAQTVSVLRKYSAIL